VIIGRRERRRAAWLASLARAELAVLLPALASFFGTVWATSSNELLSRAEKENLSHLHFLDLLLGAQADARRERALVSPLRPPVAAPE